MAAYKKQHVVPESYLSRFAEDGKSVTVLDRSRVDRFVFLSNVRDVASRKYFYDFTDTLSSELELYDVKFIEKSLHTWDGALAESTRRLDELLNSRSGSVDPSLHQLVLSSLAVQAVRTAFGRDRARLAIFQVLRDKREIAEDVDVGDGLAGLVQSMMLLEAAGSLAKQWSTLKWLLLVREERDIITSDNPVGFWPGVFEGVADNLPLDSKVHFPFGPDRYLVMYGECGDVARSLKSTPVKYVRASERDVVAMNVKQWTLATRHLVAETDVFGFVEKVSRQSVEPKLARERTLADETFWP